MSSIGGRVGPTGRAVYAAGKFGVRGIFRVPVQKGRTAWHKGHDRRTPAAFEPTSQAPPQRFVKARPEHDETVGATGCFHRNYGGNETMSLQRALSRTGLMRPNDAVGF
jgi:hypothetical protein